MIIALRRAIAFVALFAVAEAFVRMSNVPGYMLPSPSEVAVRFWELRAAILNAAVASLTAAYVGVLSSFSTALCTLLVAKRLQMENRLITILVACDAVPKVAVGPLLVFWFGYGFSGKVVMAVLLSALPITLLIHTAIRSFPKELYDSYRCLGATRLQLLEFVEAPSYAVHIFAAIRLAIPSATVGVLVMEFVASSDGLGRLIAASLGAFDAPAAFAAIGTLAFTGILADRCIQNLILRLGLDDGRYER